MIYRYSLGNNLRDELDMAETVEVSKSSVSAEVIEVSEEELRKVWRSEGQRKIKASQDEVA